jgi:hypothetical protein
MHDDRTSLTIMGLNALRAEGVISPGPYTAKVGGSDEETTIGTFERLVDAIGWLSQAVEDGALARRLNIYSAKNELVWTEPGSLSGELRENMMKKNAERIFAQTVARQEGWTEIQADDYPLAPV